MDHLSCVVCLEKAVNPCLCPKCTKLFCWSCLQSAYAVFQRVQSANNGESSESVVGCPHCRSHLTIDEFIKLNWVKDLQEELETMTKSVTDKCEKHPAKFQNIYCSSCHVTCCDDCRSTDHVACRDRDFSPIEIVWERFKDVGNITEKKVKRVMAYSVAIAAEQIQCLREKEEGDRRIENIYSEMKETLEKEFRRKIDPLKEIHTSSANFFREHQSRIKETTSARKSPMVNRLVSRGSELNTLYNAVEQVEGANTVAFSAMHTWNERSDARFVPRFRKFEALEVLKPWMPYWVIRKKVVVTNVPTLNLGDHLIGVYSDADSSGNDITWRLWLNVESLQEMPALTTFPQPARKSFTLFVTMKCHQRSTMLANYEFAIETSRVTWENIDDASTSDSSSSSGAAGRLHHTIVQRDTFSSSEKLIFPWDRPNKWIDDNGTLSLLFMVRPLGYDQVYRPDPPNRPSAIDEGIPSHLSAVTIGLPPESVDDAKKKAECFRAFNAFLSSPDGGESSTTSTENSSKNKRSGDGGESATERKKRKKSGRHGDDDDGDHDEGSSDNE